ncbi:MAG: hypothetical protein EXR73_02270 [Myxococcales bacterium]|nr:hypothetical protein [Myxococcales bacterium]
MRRLATLAALAALAALVALSCSEDPAAAKPGTGAAPVPLTTTTAAPAPTSPGAVPFPADAGAPYFATGLAAEAAAHFARDEWTQARDKFAAFAASTDAPADADSRARLAYVIAYCDARLDQPKAAAAAFDRATKALPLLADHARYESARAHYLAHDLDAAEGRARAVTLGSIPAAEARLIIGDVLRARGRAKQIAAHYEAYVADYPDGIRVSEARFFHAEALEKLGRALPDALTHYRALAIARPLDRWGLRARERMDALIKQLPRKQRAAAATLTAEEFLLRGTAFFEAMRNPESEADFRAALTADGLTPTLECRARYHLAQSIFKQRTRCKAAPLFDDAEAACQRATDVDLQVKSAYQAGRSYRSCDNEPGLRAAAVRYERVEKISPTHSYADDARVRQAETWEALPVTAENSAKIDALLASVPELYPDGDLRGEALWRLAWRAFRAGRYADAITWLDRQIAAVPKERNYWAEGQPHYWKARAHERLGDRKAAEESYVRCVAEYPLSYYSLLALNRLREGYAERFRRVAADLAREPASASGALTFAPRALWGEPGFARGVELLRLGFGALAERELARLGLVPASGRAEVTDPAAAETLWATALLYDRAQRYDRSHWIARWSVLDYKDAWPNATNRARWELAYPKVFWHLLEPAARAQSLPPELFIAFVREESAFDPIRESFANAIGLTQMIRPTAERFGKDLGIEPTRENLRDPEKNVAIGSRFLGFLWRTFDGNAGLVVPSYNAGEGAVWRFLCERGTWPHDEFAEAIPYDETRNYSKRVLSSYFTYAWLHDRTIPVISAAIPPGAINTKRCARK